MRKKVWGIPPLCRGGGGGISAQVCRSEPLSPSMRQANGLSSRGGEAPHTKIVSIGQNYGCVITISTVPSPGAAGTAF
jgi:hypothetical protein